MKPRSNWISWSCCDGERDTDTSLRSIQPTRSEDLEEISRKDTNPITSHTIGWQDHHDHLLGLSRYSFRRFSTTWYYNLMVPITHYFFIGYIFLCGRNIARNLGLVCRFFTATHLFTSPTSHKLHRIESSCMVSRSCTQRLLSVLKSEEFSLWQEL